MLVVTADDFGIAPEVNEAIELAHTRGILTAASLMVTGPAAADAVARARRLPSLRVGLHLVLVDGDPALPPARIPDLVDARGRFRCDLAAMGRAIFLRPQVREQVAAEIVAQFEAFAATGLPLDHVNAHHHFHVHPSVSAAIIRIGKHYGLRALRVPHEPAGVLDTVEPQARHVRPWSLAPWIALLRRRVRRAGLVAPDQVFGRAWSGQMIAPRIAGILARLPAGITEIYTHPATRNGFAGAAPEGRYADELAALVSPQIRDRVRAAGVRTGGFADIAKR